MEYVIGVDFDNTLVSYDALVQSLAVERGLIHRGAANSKTEVRDAVRALPDGEIEWQRIQAQVYGSRMGDARLIESVKSFFQACHQYKARVFVVSHKTRTARYDDTPTDLRQAALDWMARNEFFDCAGLGLSPEAVFFEDTRRQKLERITRLGCTHFIDDLEEVFLEDSFPAGVQKILFAPNFRSPGIPGVTVASTWEQIRAYVFDSAS